MFFKALASERTGELERRERIAARKFRDPKQSRPRGRPSEGRAQDARESARFDGPEADRVDPAFRHRLIQLERPASSGLAPLNHGDAGACTGQPADGIGERSNRRSIQPLHVVDGHEEGAGRRHGADTGVNRYGERQPVERSLGLLPAKDQVQHPCLGRREGRDDVATDAIEAPAARRRTDPSPSGSVGTTGSGNRARGPSRAVRRRASSCRCPPRPRSAARGVVRSHRRAGARRCGSHRSCLRSRATTDHHAKRRCVATIVQSKRLDRTGAFAEPSRRVTRRPPEAPRRSERPPTAVGSDLLDRRGQPTFDSACALSACSSSTPPVV